MSQVADQEESTTIHTLTQQVVACLYDKKASDIVVFDVEGQTSYCDRLVLCTGTSGRQVRALAEHVVAMVKQAGSRPLGTEGLSSGRWVLVDLGAVVVHIFDEESRTHYDLDGMWADAPCMSRAELGLPDDPVPSSEMAPFMD